MYENEPVLIPDIPGKISFKKKNGSEYVQYTIGKVYDRIRKYNLPERRIIGIRIPSIPEMMLPNENYHEFFPGGLERMDQKQQETAAKYKTDRGQFFMLQELFDQMYYEFQFQCRRKPDDLLNKYKADKINSILGPLRELMSAEEYAGYLDLIEVLPGDEGESSAQQYGKTYSDVALMLTQYKACMKRYRSERL